MEKFKEYNGILTESGFITGIEMLSAYYMTFKFWVEEFKGQSEIRKKMWYATFKNMGDDDFVKLVETYCLENIYAPQSPTSILEFAKQKYLENQPQAELEFEKVVELNKLNLERIMEIIFVLPNEERKPVETYSIIPRKGDRIVIDRIGYDVEYVEFDYDDEEIRVCL